MNDTLNMSERDIDRLRVIRNVLDQKLKQVEAADLLGLSDRQVRRLCADVREQGNRGILHGLKGRPSNNQLDAELLGMALSALHSPRWEGFTAVFAQQKLESLHGIVLSDTTVRKLMTMAGLHQPRRRGAKHRAWRERRPCVGQLVQLDGSEHDWFEGRGPKCALLNYIDDASSRTLHAEFVKVEDTINLMRSTGTYLRKHGRPVAFYVDKDSIYTVNRKASLDEELRDEDPITQFTRAMGELGIEVILANTPQGRVERSFDTHQDRLVKELRLAGISDMAAANVFLRTRYIADHNARFAVEPACRTDAHRPLLAGHNLEQILGNRYRRSTSAASIQPRALLQDADLEPRAGRAEDAHAPPLGRGERDAEVLAGAVAQLGARHDDHAAVGRERRAQAGPPQAEQQPRGRRGRRPTRQRRAAALPEQRGRRQQRRRLREPVAQRVQAPETLVLDAIRHVVRAVPPRRFRRAGSNGVQVVRRGVAAAHRGQDPVRARLDRQVQVAVGFRRLGQRLDQRVVDEARMRALEAHARDAVDGLHRAQQVGETARPPTGVRRASR